MDRIEQHLLRLLFDLTHQTARFHSSPAPWTQLSTYDTDGFAAFPTSAPTACLTSHDRAPARTRRGESVNANSGRTFQPPSQHQDNLHTPQLPPAYRPIQGTSAPHPVAVVEGIPGTEKSALTRILAARLNASHLRTPPDPHTQWTPVTNVYLGPLPQLAFDLSALLHTSDLIRRVQPHGPVVVDQYLSFLIAHHATTHQVPLNTVASIVNPLRPYIAPPTRTYYLKPPPKTHRQPTDTTPTDSKDTSATPPQFLTHLTDIAKGDETAVWLDTDNKTPDEIADWILTDLQHPHP
ncbi:hypothetical protein ACIPJS_37640 [Streptomyces sp. NPDC086783]|uniref:hypothetical protein n=1 Tax=Streptomyces sp. NPDC086783 TaxID=3365758 RepID=UPI003812734A